MNPWRLSKLLGVAVETKMGRAVGQLHDLEFDLDVSRLTAIVVRGQGLIKQLLTSDLVIPIEKVIEFTPEKIIVDDGAVSSGGHRLSAKDFVPKIQTDGEPIISSVGGYDQQ